VKETVRTPQKPKLRHGPAKSAACASPTPWSGCCFPLRPLRPLCGRSCGPEAKPRWKLT
jgi:hypothetical protein